MALSIGLSSRPAAQLHKAFDDSYGTLPGASYGARLAAFGGHFPVLAWSNSEWRSRRNDGASRASSIVRKRSGERAARGGRSEESCVVRAARENEVLESKGLTYEGPGRGGQWLSSTTRHVRIYIGVADPETKLMDQTQLDKITLMLDPDNEFLWPEDKVQKVYDYFAELVEGYAGAPCTEYTLRLLGSDIEHYIRKLLLGNEIKYNLNCRVLNFSMGKPRYESGIIEDAQD